MPILNSSTPPHHPCKHKPKRVRYGYDSDTGKPVLSEIVMPGNLRQCRKCGRSYLPKEEAAQ